jgi:hypothetical protein
VDDDARAGKPRGPTVVAGIAPVARQVALAAARAGHAAIWLVEPSDQPEADGTGARVTRDPRDCAGFAVALLTEPPDDEDVLSPVECYAAALAPHLEPGGLLVVSSTMAEHAGVVAAATVELLTGMRAGTDYGLAFLLPPSGGRRLIASGGDAPAAERARDWFGGLGLSVMPVMPVAAAEVVGSLLARAEHPPDQPDAVGG